METPPEFLQSCLWSYDLNKIDIAHDKNIIIKQILDFGTVDATDWMKQTYSHNDICKAIEVSAATDWSRKSLTYAQLVYGVSPLRSRRFA